MIEMGWNGRRGRKKNLKEIFSTEIAFLPTAFYVYDF